MKAVVERNQPDAGLTSSQATQEDSQATRTRSTEKRQVTLLSSQDDRQATTETVPASARKTNASSKNISNAKTQPSIQTTSSRTLDIPSSYVSILSSNTPATTQRPVSALAIDSPSPLAQGEVIDINNPATVWKHAMDLAGDGQSEEAGKFFKIHEALSLAKKARENGSSTSLATKSTVSRMNHSTIDQTGETFSEGGLSFIPGAVTSHMDIGFTPYFDKNLRELKGPIPLTIFNRQWQELANSYHVEKRVKVENLTKDITTYTGYPYPHEMTQSYATWNTNYRNFVRTLRDVYQFKRFAEWAEIHQANVEFYHTRDNWMTAF